MFGTSLHLSQKNLGSETTFKIDGHHPTRTRLVAAAFYTMNWHEYFTYDPETGNLIWKERSLEHFCDHVIMTRWNTRWAGKIVGWRGKKGIICKGGLHAHQIVWEMHNGPIPDGMFVDHKNINPCDNRLSNLRLATRFQNAQNLPVRRTSKSGVRGVSWCSTKNKWNAQINANGHRYRLGFFEDKEAATKCRREAELRLHKEFSPIHLETQDT